MKEMYQRNGVRYWRDAPDTVHVAGSVRPANFRETIGVVLRERRRELKLNLREMGSVSIGYASEIERGKKEMSSEVLHTLCASLDISVSEVLRRTANMMEPAPTPVKELAHV